MRGVIGLARSAVLLVLLSLVGTVAQSQSTSGGACDRACLVKLADAYFAALKAGNAGALPQAAGAKITENGATKALGDTFWKGAGDVVWRFDVANPRRGDVASEVVVRNADGSKTMQVLRLKVFGGKITEIETIKANQGDAGRLWEPDRLKDVPPALKLSIREPDRDSYYDLIGATESYWRAFQTNGTPRYRKARLLADALRFENGVQTTGVLRDGVFQDTARGFDEGRFLGRNIWDRRYPVVDEERGIVLSIVRFGLKDGAKSQSDATTNDRLVAEFFAIKAGWIQEIHAVLFNMPDSRPTGWPADDGPPRASKE